MFGLLMRTRQGGKYTKMRTERFKNRAKSRKLKKAIIAVSICIVGITAFFIFDAKPKSPEPAKYTIYVYDTGEAQIEVDSVNQIVQTHKDMILDDMILKAGTIILPGDGNEIYYEYPRHDNVIN